VGEKIHTSVAIVVFPSLARLPAIDLTYHVKGKTVQRSGGMSTTPVCQGPLGLVLELETHARLEMLRGVHSVTIDAELTHPVGQPLDDVVARRARVMGAPEKGIELRHLAIPSPLARPFLEQRARQR